MVSGRYTRSISTERKRIFPYQCGQANYIAEPQTVPFLTGVVSGIAFFVPKLRLS
ncbi:hypothetical protein BIFGAL_03866 [Bifidobacterium gallicum DSM 20093 = LMG 11596]|uniref:Uncharacterized protein n=1 Tax=Bifidobacterium gallicum DSM 20093 = LMG 11596 TaxID=561180 RepID=D1NVH6_9BIFI|nr:hypothetical protein BIFGAL_03866 [Bifidobacterium gallicum DSM 20093 = LMG 11596]